MKRILLVYTLQIVIVSFLFTKFISLRIACVVGKDSLQSKAEVKVGKLGKSRHVGPTYKVQWKISAPDIFMF